MRTLDEIENRRRKGVALSAEAARQSQKIVTAVGSAIIALQCGDITQRRLEHSLDALAAAGDIAKANDTTALSGEDRAILTNVLKHLSAVQLRETAGTMAEDVQQIDFALATPARDVDETADLGRALYDDGNAGSASFLAAVEDELSRASNLFRKCNEAHAQVDKVMEALTAFINQFMQTAASPV